MVVWEHVEGVLGRGIVFWTDGVELADRAAVVGDNESGSEDTAAVHLDEGHIGARHSLHTVAEDVVGIALQASLLKVIELGECLGVEEVEVVGYCGMPVVADLVHKVIRCGSALKAVEVAGTLAVAQPASMGRAGGAQKQAVTGALRALTADPEPKAASYAKMEIDGHCERARVPLFAKGLAEAC